MKAGTLAAGLLCAAALCAPSAVAQTITPQPVSPQVVIPHVTTAPSPPAAASGAPAAVGGSASGSSGEGGSTPVGDSPSPGTTPEPTPTPKPTPGPQPTRPNLSDYRQQYGPPTCTPDRPGAAARCRCDPAWCAYNEAVLKFGDDVHAIEAAQYAARRAELDAEEKRQNDFLVALAADPIKAMVNAINVVKAEIEKNMTPGPQSTAPSPTPTAAEEECQCSLPEGGGAKTLDDLLKQKEE